MKNNIERQRVVERDDFTYDEKMRIAEKSNNRCSHCGKQVYFGYGATVEHFIPLSKGGLNRDINLIMLCLDCNQKKGNKILYPKDYIKYLNDKDMEKLEGYFDSFTKSFEFISRGNLLACDEYKIFIEPTPNTDYRHIHSTPREINNSVMLKRAGLEDIPKLTEYLIKYQKKYDIFRNRETAELNIVFWLKFGCIYYLEGVDGVKTVAAITITTIYDPVESSPKHTMSMTLVTYYNTDFALTLCRGIMTSLPMYIVDEQGLKQIPVRVNMLRKDKNTAYVMEGRAAYENGTGDMFIHKYYRMFRGSEADVPELKEDIELQKFFEKFKDIEKEAAEWLKDKDESLSWMLNDVSLFATIKA